MNFLHSNLSVNSNSNGISKSFGALKSFQAILPQDVIKFLSSEDLVEYVAGMNKYNKLNRQFDTFVFLKGAE